jgi:hypothetical protein
MMKNIEIEMSMIIPKYLKNKDLFDWFINHDHIPFMWDYTSYQEMYKEFVEELNDIYTKTGSKFFWFMDGKLYGDTMFRVTHHLSEPILIPYNHIEVDISKMRQSKIDYILNGNN